MYSSTKIIYLSPPALGMTCECFIVLYMSIHSLPLSGLLQGTCEVLMNHMTAEIESHVNSSDPLKKEQHFALIIDGKSLEFALQETLQKRFLYLTKLCRAVICCRATPLQKSQVVKLVRNNLQVMTLAIG